VNVTSISVAACLLLVVAALTVPSIVEVVVATVMMTVGTSDVMMTMEIGDVVLTVETSDVMIAVAAASSSSPPSGHRELLPLLPAIERLPFLLGLGVEGVQHMDAMFVQNVVRPRPVTRKERMVAASLHGCD
jgi:hypothetical protein